MPTRRDVLRVGALASLGLVAVSCNRAPTRQVSLEREAIAYGPAEGQEGDLLLPLTGSGPHPVVVLIHGGFWKEGFSRTGVTAIADALGRLGYAVWNIDYRVVGRGGGFPTTLEDVALAVDHVAVLAQTRPLDVSRVAVAGHSAGGQLAMWAASRFSLLPDSPGASPVVRPAAAISLAGVLDLAAAVGAPTGPSAGELRAAVVDLVGGTPATVPERYGQLSPINRVPLGVPQLIIHGIDDATVPIDQSRAYVAAATAAGDVVRLAELPGGDHLEVIRVDRPAWTDLTSWLRERVPVNR